MTRGMTLGKREFSKRSLLRIFRQLELVFITEAHVKRPVRFGDHYRVTGIPAAVSGAESLDGQLRHTSFPAEPTVLTRDFPLVHIHHGHAGFFAMELAIDVVAPFRECTSPIQDAFAIQDRIPDATSHQ